MTDCIFCKILKGEIKSSFVYEDSEIAAFNDIHPLAPVHVLIIPKEHIPNITDLKQEQEKLAGRLIMAAKKIAEDLHISENGYKLLIRVKKHGGQEVDHIHLHLLGGAPLSENIHPL